MCEEYINNILDLVTNFSNILFSINDKQPISLQLPVHIMEDIVVAIMRRSEAVMAMVLEYNTPTNCAKLAG